MYMYNTWDAHACYVWLLHASQSARIDFESFLLLISALARVLSTLSTVVGYSTSPRLRTPHNGRRILSVREEGTAGGVLGWWNCDKAEGWAVRQSCLGWQKKKGSASELARSGGICFDNTMQGEIKSTDFIVINMNISILSTFEAVRGEVINSR